jgi:hypothetical protein
VALGVVVLAVVIFVIAAASRRRARRRTTMETWRRRAADETGEMSTTARLLAGGTPVSAAIVQQVLASLRTLEDLAQSAPDDASRARAHEAHQAVRSLAVAMDADASARRAQPPVAPEQVEAAAAGLRATATEADGVLRNANRQFTGAA